MTQVKAPARVVVLISGSGSNLQAIIDQQEAGTINIEICAVISNKDGVKGLARAHNHGISTRILNHKQFDSRESFDKALRETIDEYTPDLVVLAGFMRILTPEFTKHYLGRMFNIHPSLLPKYQGLHTHQRAIDAGDKEHGVTVHFVTAELDGGPNIIQARVPVMEGDTAEELAARVLVQEHKIYPQAVGWFADGRVKMVDGKALVDGNPVTF
ncbi:phosphoribosylglycinamide formyltransferase [Teredinibacter haidensis]|uniref:phosphoribosylglycinamide formyltransferase n=1 Tax=Teredinibacter haidensis TaxID=2731755 RepID=UPI000948B295|nr:phosphoribosylglycinamide formyltransferase [Teredinibacter haidensis]